MNSEQWVDEGPADAACLHCPDHDEPETQVPYHSTHPQADDQGRSPDAPLWSGDLSDLTLGDVVKRHETLLQTIGRLFLRPATGGGFDQHEPNRFEMEAAQRYATLAADCLNEMERRR